MRPVILSVLFLVLALVAAAQESAQIYQDAQFACTAIPQTNLNGVTVASDVRTVVTNLSSVRKVVRYHTVIASSEGRTEEHSPIGKGNLGPFGGVETRTYTPFSKASAQDEFPKTCQFTEIQVCPADPPVGFPKGRYYRPFIDGGKECKEVGNITITLRNPGGCTAITKTWAMTPPLGHHYIYGIGTDPSNIDAAVTKATMPSNDVEQSSVVMVKDCGPAHGAIAASLKLSCYNNGCHVLADGIYEEMASALSDSKDAAEQQALANCHHTDLYTRVPANDHCEIVKSW